MRLHNADQDDYKDVMVLGTQSSVIGAGMMTLVIDGAFHGEYVGAGQWFEIDAKRDRERITQSGYWKMQASSSGTSTTFTLPAMAAMAAVTDYMQGWYLQPDVNTQDPSQTQCVCSGTSASRTLPIDSISVGGGEVPHQIHVRGDYRELAGPVAYPLEETAPEIHTPARWRIYAPPGVEAHDGNTGTWSRWVAAESSRCLWMGYRYESPIAGFVISAATAPSARQPGINYAGLHYTLHRHYDPVLMRFTSPDPIASPSYNLHAYCGNNPAGGFDPDGLQMCIPVTATTTGRDREDAAKEEWVEDVQKWFNNRTDDLDSAARGIRNWAARQAGIPPIFMPSSDRIVPTGDQMADAHLQRQQIRSQRLKENGVEGSEAFFCDLMLCIGDGLPVNGWAEAATGTSSVTGETLTNEQRRNAAIFAGIDTTLFLVGMRFVRSPGAGGMMFADTALGAGSSPEALMMHGGRSYAVGSLTRVNISGNRVSALLPSKGGAGPLRWTRTNPHVSQLHAHPTTFYQLVDARSGALLKWGITNTPATRYSQAELGRLNAKFREVATGSRRDMLRLEREHIRRIPGPLNRERFAGSYWRSG